MPATCGQCRHTVPAGEKLVWCYGGPPTVVEVTHGPDEGQISVKSQRPLLEAGARVCAVFKQKPGGA